MKDGAGVAENQLLHRLFFTSSPCITTFCKSLIINNNSTRTCVLAFQRLWPEKWCKMPLLVWFSVANSSLLLSAEKPQVPATVRGIKRKLPGTLFANSWQSISSGGGNATLRQTFLTAIFYAQTIEKFVVAIPDMIESCRIAKKVLWKPKSLKCNAEDLPCQFSEICIISAIMMLVTI